MMKFKDVQEAFRNTIPEGFKCVVVEGQKRVPCQNELTPSQKDKLRNLLAHDQSRLDLPEVKEIVRELLCSDHQGDNRRRQVKLQWQAEFGDLDLTPKRTPRKSSNPSTPSPAPQRASSAPTEPFPSLINGSTMGTDPFVQTFSTANEVSETIAQSIEPVSPPPSTRGATRDEEDIFRFASSEIDQESSQTPDLAFKDGILDHQWGDSSAAVGGEISTSRVVQYARGPDGQWGKYEPDHDAMGQESAPIRSDSNSSPKTPEPQPRLNRTDASSSHRDRLSLSPEDSITKSRYSRSRSQGSRSPSTSPTSSRAKVAFETMAGDVMFDRHVSENEENVVKLLKNPRPYADTTSSKTLGWVYAIRDPELELVKIGFTTQPFTSEPGDKRLQNIRSRCKPSSATRLICDPNPAPDPGLVPAFTRQQALRVEALVHSDLRPHRWYFKCGCGRKKREQLDDGKHITEHREWYEVPDEVALETIRLWGDFILRNPYGNLRTGKLHKLQDDWIQRLKTRSPVPEDERHEHHQRRLDRWKLLLRQVPIEETDSATSIEAWSSVTESKSQVDQMIKTEDNIETSPSLHDVPPTSSDSLPATSHLSFEVHPGFQLNGEHCSPALSVATVTRPPSVDATGDRLPDVSIGSAADPPLKGQHHVPVSAPLLEGLEPDSVSSLKARRVDVHDSAANDFKLANLLGSIDSFLRKQREGLSTRTAYEDMFTFRWPITSAVILASLGPYAPPLLSAFVWLIFLPLFVAELREWA